MARKRTVGMGQTDRQTDRLIVSLLNSPTVGRVDNKMLSRVSEPTAYMAKVCEAAPV